MTPPFLSIIIPTKDRPEVLAHCLSSLSEAELTFSFEIVIVDGSVAPHTKKVCQTHALNNCIIYKTEPSPQHLTFPTYMKSLSAFMKGVLYANGTYVCYLGDDDFVIPQALNQICAALKENHVGACIPKLSAWNDLAKEEIREMVDIPDHTPIYSESNLDKLFTVVLQHTLSPEYFIYKRSTFLPAMHFLPGCYTHLLWLFFMTKLDTTKLEPQTAFLLTKKSQFIDVVERMDSPTPKFSQHVTEISENACKFISLLLTTDDNPRGLYNPIHKSTPLSTYFAAAQNDGIIAYTDTKRYAEAFLYFVRRLFYTDTRDFSDTSFNFWKNYFPTVYLYMLTQFILFRFSLLDDVKTILIHGFGNPDQLKSNIFHHLDKTLAVETWANDAAPEEICQQKNTYIVTATIAQKKALLDKGFPPAYAQSYEELNILFGLPFFTIQLDL